MKKGWFNSTNPRKLALLLSVLLTLLISILYYSVSLIFDEEKFNIQELFLIDIVIFTITYFVFEYVLRKFIYDKIRLIYKTIRRRKLQIDEKPHFEKGVDIIQEVSEEVEEWSKEHQQEISTLKAQETFRREYIGNISHELKNPIFNIQGYLYTLLDGEIDDPKLEKKYLKRANRNIERVIHIIEDLDTISELEVSNIEPHFKKFDILRLTKEVIEILDIKASNKKINIYFRESYSSPLWVLGDAHKIKQVLINLIENAIKYSSKKTRIKISFFDMDNTYLIEITDEGVGIAEKDLPRIFERFYRTDKARSRQTGGSGLGLAIVKHIIEAHHQTINVRSTLDVGTTFAFTLKKYKSHPK
jgi:two-component system phosphate regulon sensor histidine kinase PhoR